MNPKNRWIDMEDCILLDVFEYKYADMFPSDTGNVEKFLRMVLGTLIIQKKYRYSDCELDEQIQESKYRQYFIGFPGYQEGAAFDAVERYKEHTSYYSGRILVNYIYRKRENRVYCKLSRCKCV